MKKNNAFNLIRLKQFWAFLVAIALTITLPAILTACNPQSTSALGVDDNQIVISVLSDPKTFNPALSAESPSIFGLTYEGLVSENPVTGETEPRLAESWEFSDDQLSITFTLRENLKWSDGAPLTADDVVFSYNQVYLNDKIPTNSRDGLRVGIEGTLPTVEKLGDRQVKFTITEPFAPFLNNTGLSILPEHVLQDRIDQTDSEGNPLFLGTWGVSTPPRELVSNGPYLLKNYAVGQRLIFEPNPYYWQNPKPYIKQVVWQIVPNTDTTLLQFRSGDLDVTGVSPEYFSLLKREEERGQFSIYNGGPDYGTTFISFNLNTGQRDGRPLVDPIKSKWFNNVKFRQAVAQAIDRQRMVNNIYRGLGEVQHSPISVQSPFYNDQVRVYDYDLDEARRLLAEAGFSYNTEGRLVDEENNPVRFSFITNAGNKIREAMATQIEQDLEALGMQIDYSPISFNILVDKLSNSLDWDCFLLGLTGGNEPNGGANVWFPEGNLHMFNQTARAGSTPLTDRVVNDWEQEIADLYIQAAQELDFDRRKALYDRTQDLAAEHLPFIYLVNNYSLAAVRNKIEGVEHSALGGALWNIEDLTISAEFKE